MTFFDKFRHSTKARHFSTFLDKFRQISTFLDFIRHILTLVDKFRLWSTFLNCSEFFDIFRHLPTSFNIFQHISTYFDSRNYVELHSFLFIRINFIRIPRLRFASNFLAISENIRLGMYLTTWKQSFRPKKQFKAVSKGGRGSRLEK